MLPLAGSMHRQSQGSSSLPTLSLQAGNYHQTPASRTCFNSPSSSSLVFRNINSSPSCKNPEQPAQPWIRAVPCHVGLRPTCSHRATNSPRPLLWIPSPRGSSPAAELQPILNWNWRCTLLGLRSKNVCSSACFFFQSYSYIYVVKDLYCFVRQFSNSLLNFLIHLLESTL